MASESQAQKRKFPAVLNHYICSDKDKLPEEDIKVKCKYCSKEIVGNIKSTTNWWKHLVSVVHNYICACSRVLSTYYTIIIVFIFFHNRDVLIKPNWTKPGLHIVMITKGL